MNLKSLPSQLAAAGLILAAQQVWAIPGGGANLPGAALPENVGRAIRGEQPTQTTGQLPGIAEPEQQAPTGLTAEAQKIKFQLNGIILEGNHIYSEAQLRPIYQDKLHQTITVAELFAIIQNITNYYRNNGYIISRAVLPPQHVKGGIIRVLVIEGYIGKVDVSGKPRGSKCLVQAFGNRIKACRPLKVTRMEKYLLLANSIPGTEVKAVLAPSKTETGAADLTLVTENQPVVGYLSYDNYGTRYIGPQQITANAGLTSIITSGDLAQFTFTKTPRGSELTYGDLNYNMALWDEGMRWLIGGSNVHTRPLFVLTTSKIDGLTNNYYTTVQFPLIRTRTDSLTTRVGANYLDSHVTTFDQELYTDHLRNLDFGVTYNFADRWLGSNLINADLRQGLPILGYTTDTSVATAQTSRPGGHAVYTKLAAQISRLQAIHGPLSVYGLVSGQYSPMALLASEQFTYGGSQLGRGYDVAELIGDKGAAASVELRFDLAVGKILQGLQFYAYYDAGMIWNYYLVGGTPRKQSATSTGLGTRFFFTKWITGNIMWTQPLTKQVAALQATDQVLVNGQIENKGNGKQPRVFFSVVASLD